jgi:diguanylate cyclase (GGDEF)-like protein
MFRKEEIRLKLYSKHLLTHKYGVTDYYNSRWETDIKSSAICIGLTVLLLALSVGHAFMHYLVDGIALGSDNDILLIFRIIGLVLSLLIIIWLKINCNRPKIVIYERYIFVWELVIVGISLYANAVNLQSSYIGSTAGIPIVMFLYILIPQHNGVLRIIPPLIFSVGLTFIYHFFKTSLDPVGFGAMYVGIIFVNLMGAYFADKMYFKDYLLYCLSNCDELTGVYNRRYLEKKLRKEWKTCYEEKKAISCCLIDIDFFKNFNDTYGHLRGDVILKKVSATLTKSIEGTGYFVARYGGEEFIIILKNRNTKESLVFAEKIRMALEGLKIQHGASTISAYLTLSIGVSSIIPADDFKYEELINQADIALYQAKNAGRNKVVFYKR